jgi:transposase-like protein
MDMRTSKFSEEQIIGFLRQAEAGLPIKEIGRKHGFSDASFYKWRSKYASTVRERCLRLQLAGISTAARARTRYSTVTLLAKFLGLSTSVPLAQAVW